MNRIGMELEEKKSYAHILVLLCNNANQTQSMLTWYHGPFDSDRVYELSTMLKEDEFFYYGELIIAGFQDGESVQLLVELVWVEQEKQYGTGEGEVHTLPGYYDIKPLKVLRSSRPYDIDSTQSAK